MRARHRRRARTGRARRRTQHKSTITVKGIGNDFSDYEVYGTVSSATKQCVAGRKVKLSARELGSQSYEPFDTARTGAKGGWAGVGHSETGVDSIKAVLVKSKYGPKHNRKTCGGDEEIFRPNH